VGFPTIAGESNVELVHYVASLLEGPHANVVTLPGPRPDALNLHAVLGPAEVPGGLVLAAHSDVVAVADQRWSTDPFSLTERDGRLYGRGSADMKGFLAAALTAMIDAAGNLRRPLHLVLSSDEELGCLGVDSLVDALEQLDARPAGVVVGEPTGMRVAVQHKGKVGLRALLRGKAAHSSLGSSGVNAVAHAGRLIVGLLELQERLRAEAQEAAFSVPHSTLGIGPVAGGVSLNVVPDSCRLDIDVRVLPSQDPQALVDRISGIASALEGEMRSHAPEAGIAFEELCRYPALRDEATEFSTFVADLARTSGAVAVDFGTEAGIYQQRLGLPVVVCGPGSMTEAHKPDEYLEMRQLRAAQEFVAALVATLR
jgi:acetylornithine deacetylase